MIENSTVESPAKKIQKQVESIDYALDTKEQILGTTSQRKVSSKIEIALGREQFKETRWLFNQYGMKTPSWLRGKFLLNQSRRKCLNDNLREAQLDETFCDKCAGTNEWYDLLHRVWHDINEVEPCV